MSSRSSVFLGEARLVNGSVGDPVLYVDYPDRDNALLFDAGDNSSLSLPRLADLTAVFITHHHIDHFIGLDRIVRANMDREKTLSIFGPPGTIAKIVDRIKSYEFQFFPFQKIVLDLCEIHEGMLRRGHLDCGRRFPPPVIQDEPWTGGTIFENETVRVETCFADHTVTCLSYAMTEKPGWFMKPGALEKSSLRAGAWIGDVLQHLRQQSSPGTAIRIDGGDFPLATLRDKFFMESTGSKIAFITDTAWSESVRGSLIALAKGSSRLYCDSYYSQKDAKAAEKHRHMTATAAGELARAAIVQELILMHLAPKYHGRESLLLEEAREIFPRVSIVFP